MKPRAPRVPWRAALRSARSPQAAAALALVAVLATPAWAVTKLEGEYQLQLDVRKQDRAFKWDFDSNNNDTYGLTQFRLFSSPAANTEAFVKFEAEWNPGGNNTTRPQFQYREAHLRFRWPSADEKRGAEVYLFSRQDRYWVENHLIEVIRPDNLKDGDNSQGIRFNSWGYHGFDLNAIVSDFSSQSNPSTEAAVDDPSPTDDAYILRARREFFGHKLRTGVTYNRKVEDQKIGARSDGVVERAFTEVFAGDVRYAVGNTDVLVEYAESHNHGVDGYADGHFHLSAFRPHLSRLRLDDLRDTNAWFPRTKDWAPSDAAMEVEVRSLSVGTPSLGYVNLVPYYWYWGPDYNNPLGGYAPSLKFLTWDDRTTNDEEGYNLNAWYLLPERAVTFTGNFLNLTRDMRSQKKITQFYGEIYTEYVNGFRSKFYYRDRQDRDFAGNTTEITRRRDLFAEVQVENRLAWLRLQGKLKDFQKPVGKTLTSMEVSVNLTDHMKIYNRFAFADDPTRMRRGLFSEFQYRPSANVEMFLSYGPWWIGTGNNPVDDDYNLAGGADNRDVVRLILRGVF